MKILSQSAVTLIELIMATVVISIILLGITSSQVIFQKNSNYFGNSYFLSAVTDAMLNHILTSASMAIGSAAANDKGILIGGEADNTLPATTFCIHQDVPETPGSGVDYPGTVNGDLFTTPNDRWLCYTLYTPFVGNLVYCDWPYNSSLPNRGATTCVAGTVLGTVKSVTPSFGSQQALFSVTITNCMDTSQPSTCGTSSNLSVTKTGSVSPSAYSL